MALYNNVPTFSYIHATGVSVVWNGELYMVQDFSTNLKYVYWNADLPNQLNASNIMPNRSAKQHLVLVNDNGVATEVPPTTEDFSINYDGNSVQAIKDRIFGLYEKNDYFGNKFVAIEQNIDSIKQIIGDSGEDSYGGIFDRVSKVEQSIDEIDLSVKDISKKYNDDKETNKLREDLNSSIIKLNSTLGTFKGELTDYFKNNEITSEEKVKIETQLGILTNEKTVLDGLVDTVKLIAENNNQTQDVVAIESAKQALQIAHDNLCNNITNATIDDIITPTENTIIIDGFAKYNLRINELKKTCDDVIILGLGGVITEELANINIKSDEIKLSVSKVESDFKSDMSVQKIEFENQIKDVSTALNNFENTVNTTFKDGIIDEAEKQLLQEKIGLIDKEKVDIDSRYNSISEDLNLSEKLKSELTAKYNEYCSKHSDLKEKINHVISDDMVNDAEKLEVDTLFKAYANSLAYFSALINKAIEDITFNTSKAELEKAKDELQSSINGVKDTIEGIDKVLDGTFENNILDEVERENIKQNLENLSREKLDIDKTYTELYENTYLTGQDKIDLKNHYDNYISKYNEVVNVSNSILEKEELIDNVDRANMNSAIAKHNEALSFFYTQANKSIDVIATNKVNSAKNELSNNIDKIRNDVSGLNDYIDGTFKNNVIDDAERKSISQNIETLNREKADIDNTYELLYSNVYLEGSLKVDLKNSYDDFVSKHNNVLSVIQNILDKETLINDNDRESMSNSFTELNSSLSILITNISKASEYVTIKSIEATKLELQEQIKGANDRIDDVISEVEGVLGDGIIDEAETITIADNINRLNKEKLEIDAKYETIYNNSDLDGDVKTQLANAKKDFDTKFSSVVDTINTIVDDKKITDEERLKFQNDINSYNTSFANLVKHFDICIDYIADKKVGNVSSSLSKELQELQGALGGLEETMNGTFKDGILSDAEKNAIKQNLKTLETSKLNVDKQYDVVYNNEALTGNVKTELESSYNNYVSKYNSLVVVINNILDKTGLLVEADNTTLNNAFKEHNTAMSSYNEKVNIAIDYIATKNIENAKNELSNNINELNGALNNLESTMNNAFKDGVLSEAEKSSIKQHLLSVSSKKSDIDKRYATLCANENLEEEPKANLTTAYNSYISSYNSLVKVINNILEKEGLIDSVDQTNLDNAFKEHDNKLGLYSSADLNALDAIAKKKAEVESEKVDKKYAEIILDPENGILSKVEHVNEQLNGDGGINQRLQLAEEKITAEGITQIVKDIQYIKDIESGVETNRQNISEIDQKADSINLKVESKADSSNIISLINVSTEGIKIKADKVNITGFVTFSDLSGTGTTTINGSNIKTGTINANLANIININASNIVTGTLNANLINVTNLNASNIVTGTINANLINVTNLNASNITTGTLSGNRITGGVIEGTTLKTVEPSTSGGVWIKKDGLQLGSTTFHYVNNKFKIEGTQNISISTMDEIHLMAGLKADGTPDTSKERLINLSGKVTCNSLYVNGVQITGNGGVAVFG